MESMCVTWARTSWLGLGVGVTPDRGAVRSSLTLTRTRTRTRTRTQNLQAQPPGRTRATDAARAAAAPCWVWGAGPHGGEGGYGDPWVWGGDASDGAVEATVRSPRGPRDRATVSERTLAQALALTLTLPLTLA